MLGHEKAHRRVVERAPTSEPASRNATIRHLRAFLRWTIKRDWRDGDPTEHIDKTREIDDAISILSVPQAQKLLALCAADSECRPLVASIAIGLFAWLRTSELGSLDWQNVHLTGKQQFIEVAARKAKTRQRRIVCRIRRVKDVIDVQTMISIPAEIPDSPYRYVRPGALQGRERESSNQRPETFTRSTLRAVQRGAVMKRHAPP